MHHSLVGIPQSQWPDLRDRYEEQKKLSCGYNTIQCFIEWKAQNRDVDINIFSLNGEWRNDGTYVGIINAVSISYVFINTLSDDQQRLYTALSALKLNKPYMILGYHERLMPTVEQHFVDKGFKIENFKPHGVAWHHIEKAKAEQFVVETPAGFTLRRLEKTNAELVNSLWPHREPGSVALVELLITYNDSVGVFDNAGNLVAWCLILPMGALGLLQVLDTHKRMGFGNLAVRHMSKLVSAKGLEVTAPVVFQNVASRSLFKKLGFKPIGNAYFVVIPIGS
ncbi:PREDICTED: uncharacterized protein LOC108362789 [Rhagoletis zephyria]|uniref:uncharacterized protein LOC108362789 n=1 Tax=Rhagoletis zephyria TaxID=28612 RepID=UPI0008114CB7|nr:PREDICTED: uncharacterized protein LOC108362789 [Rhagoletis zephyria]